MPSADSCRLLAILITNFVLICSMQFGVTGSFARSVGNFQVFLNDFLKL